MRLFLCLLSSTVDIVSPVSWCFLYYLVLLRLGILLSFADEHSGPGSVERHAEALEREGIQVKTNSMGQRFVDFWSYVWLPKRLPSGEGDQQ